MTTLNGLVVYVLHNSKVRKAPCEVGLEIVSLAYFIAKLGMMIVYADTPPQFQPMQL